MKVSIPKVHLEFSFLGLYVLNYKIVQEIIVTTNDTIRYGFILEMFIQANIPTLFVGPTGTGKTAYIQNVLNSKLPDDKYQVIEVGFSA